MTDPQQPLFVTYCRKCGMAAMFPVDGPIETREDLLALRDRVAEECPNHRTTTQGEVAKWMAEGSAVISPPVIEELREYYGLRRPPRAS